MLIVIACVFHVLLFEGISLASLLIPQSIHPTLTVFLSAALSFKACDGRALVFSFLCIILIKALIFPPYSFSILIVIIEVVLPVFEFVFGPPDLVLTS